MKLNLKDQSSAHEKQRSTIKSKHVISAISKPLFILLPFLLFSKKIFLFFYFLLLRTVKLVIKSNLNLLNIHVKRKDKVCN